MPLPPIRRALEARRAEARPAPRSFVDRLRMTDREYRANIDGLNLFFGAVLGVVMATTEGLDARNFAAVLFVTASLVVSLLYISASRRRIGYAVLTAVSILLLPQILGELARGAAAPRQLQVTMAVWLTFIVAVEFWPRWPPEPVNGGPA